MTQPSPRHPGLRSLTLGLLACLVAGPLAAQSGTLRGRVIDDETGEPVAEATVRVKGSPLLSADSLGRFEVTGLAGGEIEVEIQALGFVRGRWKFNLMDGQILDQTFAMEFSGEKLPEVVVTARAQRLAPRYADFERRRDRGLGAYFRWEEIKARGFNTVGDALRTVRGVRIVCDQRRFECQAYMARTLNCPPQWWIDGTNVQSFTENQPIRDIYGIEIYRGPSEIPAEFTGSNSGCGAIVMWTKSRPFRSP